MKKTIFLVAALLAALLLSACQSTDIGPDISTDTTPLRSIPVDVVNSYIVPQAVTPQAVTIAQGNLFDNGGFESGLTGWTGCAAGAIAISADAYEGTKALKVNAGNCFYRSVEVNVADDLILSCYARLESGNGWTGMGLGFADASWTTIPGGPSTIITGNSYQRYDIEATVPAGSKYVSMWMYSDNPALVDECSLMLEVEPPPPPPPSGDELLENSDLSASSNTENWSVGCGGEAFPRINRNGIYLMDGCLDQSLSASDIAQLKGKDYTFSCKGTKLAHLSSYASMSVFLDGTPKSIVIPSSPSWTTWEVKGTAGNNISSGFVSVYANGRIDLSSCSLMVDGSEPQPEPQITITNLGPDNIMSGEATPLNLQIKNTGNVDFKYLNVSSAGNVLNCGFNDLDVPVGAVRSYTCPTLAVAPGETKSYTIEARATIVTDSDPIYLTETYTITQSNLGASENLLINGDFERSLTGTWSVGCGGNWSLPDGRNGKGARLTNGACMDQSIDTAALAGKEYTYSCYVKNPSGYASISIFFDGTPVSEVIPVSNDYQRVEITGTAPNASSGFVSVYTDNTIYVDDCSLTTAGSQVQPGTQQWFDRFGAQDTQNYNQEYVDAVALSSTGIFTVAKVIKDIGNPNTFSLSIRKYSRDGDVLFSKVEDLSGTLLDAATDSAGNLYVVRSTTQDITPSPYRQLDLWLHKYSPNGTKQFEKIIATDDFYGGNSSGSLYYDEMLIVGDNIYVSRKASVRKFNLSGVELWNAPVSGYGVGGLTATTDGSVYVTVSGFRNYDTTLTKLNSNGTQAWKKTINTTTSGTPPTTYLAADNSHVYVVGGTVDTFTNDSSDSIDGYLWKYDSAGNEIWTSQIATNLNDRLTSAALHGGALYTTGVTGIQGFIKKINLNSAAEEWSIDLDVDGYDIFNDIAIDNTGIYTGGYVAGTVANGNGNPIANSSDAFITKYSLP